jgi:hypothetical protein
VSTVQPDGYAVLLDDAQSAPEGFWFVGCYTKPDIAMQVAAKNKGRMVPIYFAPSSIEARPVAWRFRERRNQDPALPWGDWHHVGYEPQGPASDTFQIEPLYASASSASAFTHAANKVLELRDQTVMSKYATQAECRAVRDALWEAATLLNATESGSAK